MLKINLFIISLLICVCTISGCAAFVAGASTGVVTGYALSKDSVSEDLQVSYDRAWDVSIQTARQYGHIVKNDKSKGIIKAVRGTEKKAIKNILIKIKIFQISDMRVNLKVSARQYFMPKIDMARKIFDNIVENLDLAHK